MSSAPMYLDGLGLLVHAGEVELTKRNATFSESQICSLGHSPNIQLWPWELA